MNGHELIEMIKNNCNLDNEVKIELTADGYVNRFVGVKEVETEIERDPYDGDFDRPITVIKLEE